MYSSVVSGQDGAKAVEELAGNLGLTERELQKVVSTGGKPLEKLASGIGMTSKEFKKFHKDASASAGKLEDFAKISGMTSDEFVKSWDKNPSDALMKFVGGLGKMKDGGEDVTSELKNLGINSVQMVDTLLRASSGQDVFNKALASSKKGWEENTALVDEASKRHETLDSQLKTLKNKIDIIAQNVGGPLLKAFNSALDAMKPFLDKVIELSRWFAESDKKTQQFILSIGGILLAIGPVLKIVGLFTGSFGGLFKVLGKVTAKTDVTSKGMGALGKSFKIGGGLIGAITNPITLVVGGLAILTGALIYAYKKFEPFKKIVDETAKVVKDFATNAFAGIKEKIMQAIDPVITYIKDTMSGIKTFIDENGESIRQAVSNVWYGIKKVIEVVMAVITPIVKIGFGAIKLAIELAMKLALIIVKDIWGAIKGTIDGALKVIGGLVKVFSGIFTGDFSKMWEGVKDIFTGAIKFVWNFVQLQFFGKLLKGVAGFVGLFKAPLSAMWTAVKGFFTNGASAIWNTMKGSKTSLSNIVTAISNFFKSIFKGMWTVVKNIFSGGTEYLKRITSGAWTSMKNGVVGFKDSFVSVIKNMVKAVKGQFNDMVSWVKKVPSRMGDGLANGAKALMNGAKKMGNGMIGGVEWAVNKAIGGVNWILDKVGSSKKLSKWDAPKYAKGTPWGGHEGGLAHIGDGGKRELVHLPTGQMFLSPNKDTMVNLPKGTEVVSGPKTEQLFGGKVPRYKKGSGGFFSKALDFGSNLWSKTKEFSKGAFSKVKDWSSAIWDWVADKSSIANLLAHKIGDKIPDNPLGVSYDIMKGSIKKSIDSAKDFIFGEAESVMPAGGGSFDGAIGGHGVYKYLVDIAQKAISKFGMGGGITSGYRSGDPYSHGKRQAIDIAYPSSMNGSSKYFEPANWLFEKFKNQVAYVITQGKVRDRSGMSGQGSSGQWKHWPDNDHYDHLHVNGLMGSGDIYKGPSGGGKGSALSGSGVGRWRGQILAAAKRMRQHPTNSQVDGILAQIQLESGGNQNVTQSSSVWDVNTASGNPAKGLLQYIPQTFNAYKMRGYDNIFNGFHQLIAFFNNSNWKNDIQYGRSGWGPRGGRIYPYENGGIIKTEQMALMGEGNKPEMVVPLTKKTRAIALMRQAQDMMGIGPNSDNTVVGIMKSQNDKIDQLIQIVQYMALNSDKQQPIIINGQQVNPQNMSEDLATLSQRGRFNLGGA